jgi:hypothetical protein
MCIGQGTCVWKAVPSSAFGHCGIIKSNVGWSSIGPDHGIRVDLYKNGDCDSGSIFWVNLTFPGDGMYTSRSLVACSADRLGCVWSDRRLDNDPLSACANGTPGPARDVLTGL